VAGRLSSRYSGRRSISGVWRPPWPTSTYCEERPTPASSECLASRSRMHGDEGNRCVPEPDPSPSRRNLPVSCSSLIRTDVLVRQPTTSSADAEGPRDARRQIRTGALEKACNRGITFKDTQGLHNCCYPKGLLLQNLSSTVS